LGNKARDSIVERVIVLGSITWSWSKTNEARAPKGREISRLHHCKETEIVEAMVSLWSEAGSISGWMAHDLSFAVCESLSGLWILMELSALRLEIFLVLGRTVSFLALLGEKPSPGRSRIENDLHWLRWVSKPEFALISHVL